MSMYRLIRKNQFKICEKQCGILLCKCRHIKRNKPLDCYYFKKKIYAIKKEIEQNDK